MKPHVIKKLDDFFTNYKHRVYKKGEILIQADENPSGIFFLKSGNVKEYVISKKGDEIVVNIFKPPSFFPMSWAMNDTPNKYFFEATTPTEVWEAPKEKVIDFIKNDSEILYDLLSRVYLGTDGLLSRMTHLMSGNAYTKLIIELLLYLKRFGHTQNQLSYEVKITESELAAHAGIARETVSRELKILKEKDLVEFSKNILRIPNINKLEIELNSTF